LFQLQSAVFESDPALFLLLADFLSKIETEKQMTPAHCTALREAISVSILGIVRRMHSMGLRLRRYFDLAMNCG
jgi:hypothetical protein